jgi:cytoskeletal protein CcmA (bactofilin family)
MYELERKSDEYPEAGTTRASVGEVIAADISGPFELWFSRMQADAAAVPNDSPAEARARPFFIEGPTRAETPPPSLTHTEYITAFELKFDGTLCIEGYFTGQLYSDEGTLVLAEDGEINTDIAVGVAVINGTVVGNIRARRRIELGSGARVIGDLYTPALTVMPGAIFEGKCYSQDAPGKGKRRIRQRVASAGETESSDPAFMRARQQKPSTKKGRASRKPDWRRS